MTRSVRVLRGAYAALAVADAALSASGSAAAHRARRLTKPLLMPTLAAAFAADPRSAASPVRRRTQLAQAAGWLGDVALLRPGTAAFLTGMSAFAAGQVSYLSGLRELAGPRPVLAGPIGRGTALAFALTGPPMAYAAAREDRVLGPAVLAYAALLSAMAAHAGNLDPALPVAARRASAAGGLAFLLSDSLIGAGQFLRPSLAPRLEPLVMIIYTAAQGLLAEGALAAGR